MKKRSQINFVLDCETKEEVDKVFEKLGITMSQAIKLFMRQVVIEQGIPFNLHVTREEK
jgi:DNA-damage-inducible protein J